ncbi:hypothetical protein H8E88_33110 [candidate division KSB1 bacterium]|nr:hypothetical protein [candidate division KSB1 bacterium]MBL7094352.1 hypothetical protein [candidate division KSB1 bacterium]
MYKLLIVLLAAALLSFGLTFPELILQQDQIDSTLSQIEDNGLTNNSEPGKILPGYDVPRPDGEPLPPPPDDDDEYELPPSGGD